MRAAYRIAVALAMLTGALAATGQEPAPPPPPDASAPPPAPPPGTAPPQGEAPPRGDWPPPAPPLADIRQVQVQVWISETNEDGLRDIGNNLQYKRFVDGVEQSGSVQQVVTRVFNPETGENFLGPTLPAPVASPPDEFDPPLRPDSDNDPTTGIRTPSGFGLSYTIVEDDRGTLEGVFRAIETRGDVDLMSKPELLVANGMEASIKAGTRFPYQTVNPEKRQLKVDWKDLGVNLTLRPTIMQNDYVQLNITELNVSERQKPVESRGIVLPVFTKRSQTGVVVVPDGQTLVIGGLSSRKVTRSEQRVPVLGKIPLLGMPFRHRVSEARVSTLLVFVQPTVVDLRGLSQEASSALEFWQQRGSEWAHRERIETEIVRMNEGL